MTYLYFAVKKMRAFPSFFASHLSTDCKYIIYELMTLSCKSDGRKIRFSMSHEATFWASAVFLASSTRLSVSSLPAKKARLDFGQESPHALEILDSQTRLTSARIRIQRSWKRLVLRWAWRLPQVSCLDQRSCPNFPKWTLIVWHPTFSGMVTGAGLRKLRKEFSWKIIFLSFFIFPLSLFKACWLEPLRKNKINPFQWGSDWPFGNFSICPETSKRVKWPHTNIGPTITHQLWTHQTTGPHNSPSFLGKYKNLIFWNLNKITLVYKREDTFDVQIEHHMCFGNEIYFMKGSHARARVVGFPTRRSLLFIFGFLFWFPNPDNREI